ncbi:MAG: hypothetical protein KME32_24135 [Mojavia pulchra JT2-VF2]|jgi:hypothetical protein|uniref:Uncharacterized protein n=1 Tax=Mojavia pulchra JT2-VF2 TaxID=287848 RepID=A0A951Q1F3_9NOST|nr:hypothetical protein [Mojavia pulchra JT2-VF2]
MCALSKAWYGLLPLKSFIKKAIEGTANVNPYQAIKEIALEQAKSQVKNK